MKILFVSSSNMMASHLSYLMKQEGNEVKLFIDDEDRKGAFENLVEKSEDWRKDLAWVGKGADSLIVFDDIGYGKIQDELREEGYSVFGGSLAADTLESDREFAQKVFEDAGMKIVPFHDFDTIKGAGDFVKKNGGSWVIKQNGDASKSMNYVSHFDDGRDLLNVLENYERNQRGLAQTISLQQKIKGVEIGVARYFNGNDWVGPMEINLEHKKLFPGDLGPATSEMGTLAWYDDNEKNKLFCETLARLKPYLKKIDFRGDIDINCIVNETGAYPLEATPRFGSPIIYLHAEIHKSPWGKFLKAIADGKKFELDWKKGYGIVVLLAVPPFPYAKKMEDLSPNGNNVYIDPCLKGDDLKHIHFEGVAQKIVGGEKQYHIADEQGYGLYVTSVSKTVADARKKAYSMIKHIYTPKMFYRNDIGIEFIKSSRKKLEKWGYL